MKILATYILVLFSVVLFSQNEANIWYFGDLAGIDFNNGEPLALTNNDVMSSAGGTAVMSDKNGDFLFMTNGETLWNRDFEVMQNGDSLNGNAQTTQACIIIPNSNDEDIYYVFTLDRAPPLGSEGLHYSIVDMSQASGRGAVVDKNIQLLAPASEKLTATLHENLSDVWVIVHGWDNNLFHAFLVTKDGVNHNAVVTAIGSEHSSFSEGTPVGAMKASPDGSKLALSLYNKDVFEFFSFNNLTGVVSDFVSSNSHYRGAFGVEFSPNSRKVYGSTYFLNDRSNSYIFQFDIKAGDIAGSALSIPTPADIPYLACAMQLGPNGKIYVSRFNGDSLGVILNPNRDGIKCDYIREWVGLDGRTTRAGLPAFIQNYFDIPDFLYFNDCLGDTTWFDITNKDNIDSVYWDFSDPESGMQNFSTLFQPWHIFSNPGTHMVKLIIYYGGDVFKHSAEVLIRDLPTVDLGESQVIYPNAYITLDAGDGMAEYLWQDGSDLQTFLVKDHGLYSVEVTDEFSCKNSDSTSIYYLEFAAPNAFTPNGDGINDHFLPVLPEVGVSNYNMIIFNRWGRQVFETKQPEPGWDGTSGGELLSPGAYVWVITFDAQVELYGRKTVEKHGTVMLLR